MKDDYDFPPGSQEHSENDENQLQECHACFGEETPQYAGAYPANVEKNSGLAEIRETGEAQSYGSTPPADMRALQYEGISICDNPILDGAVEFTLSDIIGSLSVTNLENLLEILRENKKQSS